MTPLARLVRAALVALVAGGSLAVLVGGGAEAQEGMDVGPSWDLRVEPKGGEGPVRFELRIDPDVVGRGEVRLFLFPRGGEGLGVSRIAPPAEPGLWTFEVPREAFERRAGEAEEGFWGASFRYGVGLDLWYGFAWVDPTPDAMATRYAGVFRGGLGDAPSWIQPVGFAVFGAILAGVLALVGAVLARLRRAQLTPV